MACGCQDTSCSCVINGANGNIVSGSGTVTDPYVITAPDDDPGLITKTVLSYSVAEDGGAIGVYDLGDLPTENVLAVVMEVTEEFTSAGVPDFSLGVGNTAYGSAPTALTSGNPLGFLVAGYKAGAYSNALGFFSEIANYVGGDTGPRFLRAEIADAALTAGALTVSIYHDVSA